MEGEKKIRTEKNGPYHVSGHIPLRKEYAEGDENNDPVRWRPGKSYGTEGDYSLCRCGHSKSKPFCDGTHKHIEFDGTETAEEDYWRMQAQILEGPDLDLLDIAPLCAGARFCHRRGGTWDLTEKSDDPEARELAIRQACNCPAGRLTALLKGLEESIEPEFPASISVIEDLTAKVSGPLWLKGGIRVEAAEGKPYAVRNRQTLCRCGQSKSKPFCDASHVLIRFNDGTFRFDRE
jgi:CDGSH-type Zn-finger protein